MAWDDAPGVRQRLAELAAKLEDRDESILSRVSRVQSGRGSETWFVIRDFDDQEIARIPTSEADHSDPRAWLTSVLKVTCVGCGDRLLAEEDSMCGPCEAGQIMGLLRLRSDLA